jgi:hypothetical protein
MLNNYYRRKKHVSLESVDVGEITDPAKNPSEELITQEEHVMLEKVLMQMPAEYREPLVMYYRQGKSTAEVAASLDLNESTVRTRLSRARKMLREKMADRIERSLERSGPSKAFTTAVMASVAGVALKGAGVAAAATAASTTSTGVSAVLGTVAAKIVTAAVVAVIGIGAVVGYKNLQKEEVSPKAAIAETSVVQQGEAIPGDATDVMGVENGEATNAADQRLGNVANEISANAEAVSSGQNAGSKQTAKDGQSAGASKGSGGEVAEGDRDNRRKGIMGLRVVTKETGEVIASANVSVSAYSGKNKEGKGTTNQFGRYDVEVGKEKLFSLSVAVTVEGRVPIKISYRDEGGISVPLNYKLELEKGTSIGGIIENEQGQAVEEASVYLLVPGEGYGIERPSIWDHVVKTDKEGNWRCDIMPSKLEDVWIRLGHKDYINDDHYNSTGIPTIAELRDMTGAMVMKKGLSVNGIVTDMEGKPIANAEVVQGSDRMGSHYPDTKTDENGKFSFKNANPGEMVLTVSAEGMSPDLRVVDVRSGLGEVNFTLDKGKTIHGRLINVDGNPIRGVFVAADTWRGHRSNHWRVDTNEEGSFRWDSAPADEVEFDIGKQDYMSLRNIGLTASDDPYEIVMYRPVKVRGTVVDAVSGEKIPSFNLISGTEWENNENIYWSSRDIKTCSKGEYTKIFNEPRFGYVLKVEAEGYLPGVSQVFGAEEEEVTIDFALEKGEGKAGVVYLPDGALALGAEVVLSTRGISLRNGMFTQKREYPYCETDINGMFSFKPQVEDFVIVAIHEQGWAKIYSDELDESDGIVLERWARVEGTVYLGKELGASETVNINRVYSNRQEQKPKVHIYGESIADKEGRFEFNRVVAGKVQVSREIRLSTNRSTNADNEFVKIAAGETVEVNIGGKGRPVAGRFVVPAGKEGKIDWKIGWVTMSTKLDVGKTMPKPVYPKGFAAMSKEEQHEWYLQWTQSEDMAEYRAKIEKINEQRKSYPMIVHEDGTFEVAGAISGHYQIRGTFTKKTNDRFDFDGKPIGGVEFEFDIAEIDGGISEEVLELGDIEVEVYADIKIGKPAPGFEVKDMSGNVIRLSDYRGRFVLIDQWHRHGREDAQDGLEEMGRVYEKFGGYERFAMLSVTGGNSTPPALMKEYAEYYGMKWDVGLFENSGLMGKAMRGYGIKDFPGRFLIGQNGELLGRNLQGQELIDAIETALEQ